MAEHRIALDWSRGDAPFTYEAYPRNHTIAFKGGAPVTFSAAPAYKGDTGKGDPEDLLVAALSSCHMLSFLAIAAKKK
jgi:organic hydroperoxide reductase OsmC/OhrA